MGPTWGIESLFEGAQHVNQRVHIAQAGQERGLFQRLLPDGRHVNKFNRCVGGLFRRVERRELIQPLVGHARHADVLLARVAAILEFGLGKNLEQRSFAHLRQADNASLHIRSVRAPARCIARFRASSMIQEQGSGVGKQGLGTRD